MSARIRHGRAVRIAFGSVLRSVRVAAGVSQKTLALDAGLARAYPSLLERGLRGPSLVIVFALARALRVDPVLMVSMTLQRLHAHTGAMVEGDTAS
jgi:transcriptional regulator with XRE-family HTH domain